MVEPARVIETICEENLRFYGNERGRGALMDLQRDFPYPWLYVAELLQNAVDAGAHSVRLQPDQETGQFIFEHDGEAFLENHVKALCSKGVSTKGAGAVGFMGIGFKAVFHSYRRVDISSGQWRFYLEVPISIGKVYGDRQRDWLGSVLPKEDKLIGPPTRGMTCRFVLRDRLDVPGTPEEDMNNVLSPGSLDLLTLLASRGVERLEVGNRRWTLAKRTTVIISEHLSRTILEALDENSEEVCQWILFSAKYDPSTKAVARFLEHRQLNLDDPQLSPNEREKGYEESRQKRKVELFCSLDINGNPLPPTRPCLFALLSTGEVVPENWTGG